MTLKSGEDQRKFTHDRHPTLLKKIGNLSGQNLSYAFSMGYKGGGGPEFTLPEHHQILDSLSMILSLDQRDILDIFFPFLCSLSFNLSVYLY